MKSAFLNKTNARNSRIRILENCWSSLVAGRRCLWKQVKGHGTKRLKAFFRRFLTETCRRVGQSTVKEFL